MKKNLFLKKIICLLVVAWMANNFLSAMVSAKSPTTPTLTISNLSSDPIQISEVSVGGVSIENGVVNTTDPDWVRKLNIRVSNSSNKAITRIDLDVEFEDATSDSSQTDQQETLAIRYSVVFSQEGRSGLRPLETSVISNHSARNVGQLPLVAKATLSVGYIYFEDKTAWHLGLYHRQDSDGTWRPVQTIAQASKPKAIQVAFLPSSALGCTHRYETFRDRVCTCGARPVTKVCTFQEDQLAAVGPNDPTANCRLKTVRFTCEACECPVARVENCGKPIRLE